MNKNTLKQFLINYVESLFERTRYEKNNLKIGFDWLIYQICLMKNYIPIRLPFIRQSDRIAAKTKTEAEFGIDMSFLSTSEDELFVFVLKDEVLNNKNWITHTFDNDIRMASTPDLTAQGMESVKIVNVILAYNKDEDSTGEELYNRLINSLPTKIYDKVDIHFEKWNLTRIVDEIEKHLLIPEIMPQHLYGTFQYICSQYKDFKFCSEEWEKQLVPNWKNFLNLALSGNIDERKINLIPVTLIILRKYQGDDLNSYAGWIDLIEWAMLSLWLKIKEIEKGELEKIVITIWIQFYVYELEKYIIQYSDLFTTQHGFSCDSSFFGISAINDAYKAFWHMGRLGILTIAPMEFRVDDDKKYTDMISTIIQRSSEWLIKCLHLNPASMRPLTDLNHTELFLIWFILYQAGRLDEIQLWLSDLESRLLIRKHDKNLGIPFIESRSRFDLVVEYVVTGERPNDFSDKSSYLLLMLLELCFSLHGDLRNDMLNRYYKRIIKGIGDDGQKLSDEEIDLVSWVPPENWGIRVLNERVSDGIAITMFNFNDNNDEILSNKIIKFIEESRKKYPWKDDSNVPLAVKILACIKNHSPLPPEIWRNIIFPKDKNNNVSDNVKC